MKSKMHPILHTISFASAISMGVFTFLMYAQETTIHERLIYAGIIGLSTLILLYLTLWTCLWVIEGFRK